MFKNKKNLAAFVVLMVVLFALTSIAVYLAQTLQYRQKVSPAVPESIPGAAVPDTCKTTFAVSPLSCYEGTCSQDSQCGDNLVCDSDLNTCVNPDCREDSDCNCTEATSTPTDTPTTTATATATSTSTATPTTTATATPTSTATTQPYSCDSLCDTDSQCQSVNSNYICYSQTGTCRHKDYPSQSNCLPQGATASPNPTFPPNVPDTGIGVPTIAGFGAGVILILAALLIAF